MRETEWLSIMGLALAGDAPPKAGSVIIDLTDAGPNPKFGVVVNTAARPGILQLNDWWGETKPLHVHPWNNEDVDLMLTGLEARLEIKAIQDNESALNGHGLLTVGTGGVRLHCTNILAPKGMGSRLIIDPHSWVVGSGVDIPRHGTRNWRIVADTPRGSIVLCEGSALAVSTS